MSFRGDDQRRYGHVPPVQYPVANQPHPDQTSYGGRRQSFNQGDDRSHYDQAQPSIPSYPTPTRGDDELFLTSPANRTSMATFQSTGGYQPQYQPASPQGSQQPAYNPQNFPRTQSTSLPYHPAAPAPSRYASVSGGSYHGQQTTPTSYTPQAYNPAAYANVPQRNATYHGQNTYGQHYGTPQPSASYGSPTSPLMTTAFSPNAQQQATPPIPQYNPSASLPSPPAPQSATSQTPSYDTSYSPYIGAGYGYSSNGNSAASTPYSAGGTTTVPYPSQSQIPVGPHYSVNDSQSFFDRAARSSSQMSGLPSPPPQQASSLQRHPTNAPLPGRPAGRGNELHWRANGAQDTLEIDDDEQRAQDDIINDIEAELAGTSGRQRPAPINGQELSDEEMEHLRRYDSGGTAVPQSARASNFSHSSTVGYNNQQYSYDYDDDDGTADESDPEGTAGVLAMQQAELEDRRFSGNTFTYNEQPQGASNALPPPPEEQSSDSDFGGMDLGMLAGGYAGNLAYGNDVGSPPPTATTHEDARPPPPASYFNTYSGYDDSRNDAPAFHQSTMDYPEAGGLHEANAHHRLSFDDREERVSVHSGQSGSESPYKDDYPDIFYHPGLSNRPLPALPAASDSSSLLSRQASNNNRGSYQYHSHSLSADYGQPDYGSPTTAGPERSISFSSHSTTPPVQAPMRSRTDAADDRKKLLRAMAAHNQAGVPYEYDTGTPSSTAYDMITIPTGRRKKQFIPSKLSSHDIKRCTEPWALSGIAAWVREMAEGEPDLKKKTVEEGLVRLFTVKVPTMNVADAEMLSMRVVELMLESGILIPEEEWVKFGPGSISGVLWQLTGSGCYSPKLHETESSDRCYSYHCMRTLKKANLDDILSEDFVKTEDWATFYKLNKESIGGKHKKEIERQNVLHEIVTSEEGYMNQLEVLRVLYRDQLRRCQPPIIAPNKIDKFLITVFGKVDAVMAANKDNLLAQLKYRQKEQGPWIAGFSDLFREWIRKARTAYVDYAAAYPHATFMVRREKERNLLFKDFLDTVRNHKRSERLDWTHFLKTPITRLQRYTFLLETVKKNMLQDTEEKTNLTKAIQEIHEVTLECDARVAEMQMKVEMAELNSMLVLRPGFQSMLNLDHLGRELLLQGDLQRMGSKGVRWVDTHALLFDHYLILAKVVQSKDGRERKYDVSKEPIPMPLLFLESANDDAVSKQKGITAPLARTTTNVSGTGLNKTVTNGSERPGLEHAATSSSATSGNRLPPGTADPEGKILYPFKIKHLGHEVYTLYASTPDRRQEWSSKIIEAKTRHAKALFSQNAEPFRLRVLADSSFAYDSVSGIGKQPGVHVRGTPLDRAIRELEQVYGPGRGPAPVCRAQVNCATGFHAYGKSIIAIGTDYGVFISDASDPRGWQRTVAVSKVTQIAVLEEFSVCLIIADRSLISYPLDVVAPVSNFPAPAHDSPRRAPQKLAKDVSFFAAARMKERMLVFYKKKEGVHNTFFKVLEPVFHKTTEKKSRWLGSGRKGGGSGTTETFRDYDEFFFPTECYSLNLFQTYIAVSTAKGFELLTLDKKQPMSIPDLKQPAIANIAARIRDQKPLGMFRLNDQEFLLTYEDCAVYVDKHGDVSRTLIMEYSGKQRKSRGATLCGQYLLLFNEDYVEVRNAENGRLRQIIAGRDVRCLDFGARGPTGTTATPPPHQHAQSPSGPIPGAESVVDSKTTVKISMAHPEIAGMQIVLELLLNDGHMEK